MALTNNPFQIHKSFFSRNVFLEKYLAASAMRQMRPYLGPFPFGTAPAPVNLTPIAQKYPQASHRIITEYLKRYILKTVSPKIQQICLNLNKTKHGNYIYKLINNINIKFRLRQDIEILYSWVRGPRKTDELNGQEGPERNINERLVSLK